MADVTTPTLNTYEIFARAAAPADVGGGPSVEDTLELCNAVEALRTENERLYRSFRRRLTREAMLSGRQFTAGAKTCRACFGAG